MYCTKGKYFLYKNPNNGEFFLDRDDGYRGGDYESRFLTQKIIGEFVCERVTEHEICDSGAVINYWAEGLQHSCLTISQIDEYVGKRSSADYYKKSKISALHIHAVKFYDNPKELSEYIRECCQPAEIQCENCPYCKWSDYHFCTDKRRTITRPPRGWQYVEILDEKF